MTLIVQSYFDTLLRYVLSVLFCGAVVMKVMDQKTLVKRRWSYKVRRTVYILTLSEFTRHEFTNLWLETFSWSLPDTLSLSLTGIRLGPKQARRANDSTASLSLTWDQALFIYLLLLFFASLARDGKNNAWYIHLTSHQPPPNLHNLTSALPVMLLANQRLPDGDQIWAGISLSEKENF